ncbi:histidine phosphatase family protein [Pseudomonas akapageensis]|uniref:lipopolysaccharide core heptose(II)-phosphate phosphatase PmrG n=1 Tax=Pseudomonas akapageensis TaxID=2609961 RepID=UPI00140E24ED|nr:histidine phosphatase family protein [Pseudomonas akapageensis]
MLRFVGIESTVAKKLFALLALTAATLWLSGCTRIEDLDSGAQMTKTGVYAGWAKGEIIVLVRHAERCDRSDNPCLADADGITIKGSETATQVGQGIKSLGLDQATILSSPETRTKQTAYSMFGKPADTQEWLKECDQDFTGKLLAHKQAHRNLVLITHSGCIDHFARDMKVSGGQRSSDYTEAFFISVDELGKPKILGSVNAAAWQRVLAKAE